MQKSLCPVWIFAFSQHSVALPTTLICSSAPKSHDLVISCSLLAACQVSLCSLSFVCRLCEVPFATGFLWHPVPLHPGTHHHGIPAPLGALVSASSAVFSTASTCCASLSSAWFTAALCHHLLSSVSSNADNVLHHLLPHSSSHTPRSTL